MGFRTVVITKHCKCSFKNGYLLIKDEKISMVHISEVNTVIFETPAVSITGVLLSELAKEKVCIIFCNEKHLPQGQYIPFSANYMSASHVIIQSQWDVAMKDLAWRDIVCLKIRKQSEVLKAFGRTKESELLNTYIPDVTPGDLTNREGFAAKVYFNALFEEGFSRRNPDSDYNACLDYGYAVLLAIVSREVVKNGYELALGIHHHGMFNSNNLACDIMEPFRPLVDYLVLKHYTGSFDLEMKKILWDLGNAEVSVNGTTAYLNNAVSLFFREVCNYIENGGGALLEYQKPW